MPTPPHILAYREAGSGPSVVLLHGLPASSSYWLRVIPLLEDTYHLVAPDLLGFGHSPKPKAATYSIDEHVAAVVATLEAIDLPKPWTLVGHSMGSLVALRLANTHPDWLRKLVLISFPAYDNVQQARRQIIRSGLAPRFMLEGGRARRTTRSLHHVSEVGRRLSVLFHPLTSLQVPRHGTRHTRRSYRLALEQIIYHPTDRSHLEGLKLPVTIINGERDHLLRGVDYTWFENLAHVQTYWLPKGHQLPLDDPANVARIIARD